MPRVADVTTSFSFKERGFREVFSFKQGATRELGWVRSLQPCLARRASLKTLRSLNPIPPCFLWWHNLFQLIQWIFLLSELLPYQNLHTIFSMYSQKPLGNKKLLIIYVGIACATALMRTLLPGKDRCFSFHPLSFFQILSWT